MTTDENNGTELSRRGLLTLGGAAVATMGASGISLAQTLQPPPALTGAANAQGRFAGKVVLITGGTYGIGQTTAEAFAREGAKVAFCGRTEDLGRQVESGIRASGGDATYFRADVRSGEDVKSLVDGCVAAYGRLDIAFNNAAYFMDPRRDPDLKPGPVHEMSDAHWAMIMDTNAGGVWRSMRHEVPVMLSQDGGVIINNASVSGHVAFPGMSGYAASKHAVIGLTKVAAAELADKNIRVVSLPPLAVDTPMLRASMEFFGVPMEQAAAGHPFKRINTTDEMARVVMFLASDDATSIGGTDIDVTGGYISK